MKKDLKALFEAALRDGARSYQQKAGAAPTRYLQSIERLGAVGAAAEFALNPRIQTGLQRAAELDCIETTAEYLIVEGGGGEFSQLFPDSVVKAAKRKLEALRGLRHALVAGA